MTHPANLQPYADQLTKHGERYRNTQKLWERILASSDRALAGDIKRDTNKAAISDKLLARIKSVVTDTTGPNRGHQNLSTPKGGNGGLKVTKGKGK